jgi:hypothetical protein
MKYAWIGKHRHRQALMPKACCRLPFTFFALVAAMNLEETLARCIIQRHV